MVSYGKFYRSGLWPLYERLRGRNTHRYAQLTEQNQWLPTPALEQLQLSELRQLLSHTWNQSPWYAARLEQAGLDPQSRNILDDLRRLPFVTKAEINTNRDTMLAHSFQGKVYEHCTGGSTGAPLRFYVNRASYEWRVAVSMRGYSWAGCREGDRQFYVWGAPISPPPWAKRVKTWLHNTLLQRRIFSSFGFSRPAMSRCAEAIRKFRPQTVIGYTNAIFLLAQHVLENKLAIVPPQAIITAAEGVNAVQRAIIEQAFDAPVFASYGSREFMLIAMECERHHGLHLSADNLLVEVVRPDGTPAGAGEIGEIVITDLHNYGMPLIRYKIGDLGALTSRTCPCGRGLPLLERVEGRVLDAIRTPDGRIVPGEFFPHLLKEFDAVREFQVIQKQLDHLTIKLVLRPDSPKEQLDRIQQEIRKVMGPAIKVEIEPVGEIPRTVSGKFRVTVSELGPNHWPLSTGK